MKSNTQTALDTSPAGDELDLEQLAAVNGGSRIVDGVVGWLVGKALDGLVAVAKDAPHQWSKGAPYNEVGLVN